MSSSSSSSPTSGAAAPGELGRYLAGSEEDKAFGLFGILNEQGECADADIPDLDREQALALYRGMVMIRTVDARMIKLQRQGRIGFYGEALGQEASVVGTAAALLPQDWLIPALREAGAGLYRGLPLRSYIAQILGNANDPSKGRQMPCHPGDRATNYVPMSSCVSSQIPHAVGIAMAMKLKGDTGPGTGSTGKVCIGYMGDGGTSEGDFHVGMNFAGVSRAPVVLVCQNNQWAISTPGNRQTAAETIASKGIGYGIESLRADGNDVLAVHQVARYAVEKARRGDGATFLELLTYRVGAHSSSDDPSKYRDESVTDDWKDRKDPLRRYTLFLERKGWLPPTHAENMVRELDERISAAIEAEENAPGPVLSTLIDDVYEQPGWNLREQMAELESSIKPAK